LHPKFVCNNRTRVFISLISRMNYRVLEVCTNVAANTTPQWSCTCRIHWVKHNVETLQLQEWVGFIPN